MAWPLRASMVQECVAVGMMMNAMTVMEGQPLVVGS